MAMSPPAEKPKKKGETYLTPPKGFRPPENSGEGESFTVTLTGRMDGDMICVEKIGDMPLDKVQEEDEPKEEEATETKKEEVSEGHGSMQDAIRAHFGKGK